MSIANKRTLIVITVLALAVIGAAGMTLFERSIQAKIPADLPVPFANSQGSTLQGSVVSMGSKGGLAIDRVTFGAGTESEALVENKVYIILTPSDSEAAPLTVAFQNTTNGEVNFFGYKYTSGGTAERQAQSEGTADFLAKYPGTFFASPEAVAQDSAQGGGLASFTSFRGVTFADADTLTLEPNTLYAIVVNDPQATLYTKIPVVCGDGYWSDSEACEDGNTVSGDGCSSACQLEEERSCLDDTSPTACGAVTTNTPSESCGPKTLTHNAWWSEGSATQGRGSRTDDEVRRATEAAAGVNAEERARSACMSSHSQDPDLECGAGCVNGGITGVYLESSSQVIASNCYRSGHGGRRCFATAKSTGVCHLTRACTAGSTTTSATTTSATTTSDTTTSATTTSATTTSAPSLCGNGTVDTGEECDEGAADGMENSTCSTDCRSITPFGEI